MFKLSSLLNIYICLCIAASLDMVRLLLIVLLLAPRLSLVGANRLKLTSSLQREFQKRESTMEWPCLDVGMPSIASIAAGVRGKLSSVVSGLESSFQSLLSDMAVAHNFFQESRQGQQDMASQAVQNIKTMFIDAARGMVDLELLRGPNTVLVGLSASASRRFTRAVPHLENKFRNSSVVGVTLWFDPKTLSMIGEAEGSWNFVDARPTKPSTPWSVEGMIAAKLTTDSSVQRFASGVQCGPSFTFGYSVPTAHGAIGMSASLGLNENYQIEEISVGFTLGSNDGMTVALGYSAAQGLVVRELPRSYDVIVADMLKNDPPLRLIYFASDHDSFEANQTAKEQLGTMDLLKSFFTGTTAQ